MNKDKFDYNDSISMLSNPTVTDSPLYTSPPTSDTPIRSNLQPIPEFSFSQDNTLYATPKMIGDYNTAKMKALDVLAKDFDAKANKAQQNFSKMFEQGKISFNGVTQKTNVYDTLSDGKTWVANYKTYKHGIDNYDDNARNMGNIERIYNTTFGTGVRVLRGGVSDLLSIPAGLIEATIRGNADYILNSSLSQYTDDLDNANKAYYKNFYTKDVLADGLGFNLATYENIVHGLEYSGRFVVGDLLLAHMTGGTSLTVSAAKWAGRIAKGTLGLGKASKAVDIARTGAEIGSVLAETSNALGRSASVSKLAQAGNVINTADNGLQALGKIGQWTKTASAFKSIAYPLALSSSEASVEARHFKNEAIADFWDYHRQNGTEPTDEEIVRVYKEIDNNTWKVYGTNLALLTTSNMIMFPKLLGVTNPISKIVGKVGTTVDKKLFKLGTEKAIDGTWKAMNATWKHKAMNIVSRLAGTSFTEGVFEEGTQGIVGQMYKNYSRATYDPNHMAEIDSYTDMFLETAKQYYGSDEGQEEMIIGAIVGALFGIKGITSINKEYSGQKEVAYVQNQIDGFAQSLKEKNYSEENILSALGNFSRQLGIEQRKRNTEAKGDQLGGILADAESLISLLQSSYAVGKDDYFREVFKGTIKGMDNEVLKDSYGIEGEQEVMAFKENTIKGLDELIDVFDKNYKLATDLFAGGDIGGFTEINGVKVNNSRLVNGFTYMATMGRVAQQTAVDSFTLAQRKLAENFIGKESVDMLGSISALNMAHAEVVKQYYEFTERVKETKENIAKIQQKLIESEQGQVADVDTHEELAKQLYHEQQQLAKYTEARKLQWAKISNNFFSKLGQKGTLPMVEFEDFQGVVEQLYNDISSRDIFDPANARELHNLLNRHFKASDLFKDFNYLVNAMVNKDFGYKVFNGMFSESRGKSDETLNDLTRDTLQMLYDYGKIGGQEKAVGLKEPETVEVEEEEEVQEEIDVNKKKGIFNPKNLDFKGNNQLKAKFVINMKNIINNIGNLKLLLTSLRGLNNEEITSIIDRIEPKLTEIEERFENDEDLFETLEGSKQLLQDLKELKEHLVSNKISKNKLKVLERVINNIEVINNAVEDFQGEVKEEDGTVGEENITEGENIEEEIELQNTESNTSKIANRFKSSLTNVKGNITRFVGRGVKLLESIDDKVLERLESVDGEVFSILNKAKENMTKGNLPFGHVEDFNGFIVRLENVLKGRYFRGIPEAQKTLEAIKNENIKRGNTDANEITKEKVNNLDVGITDSVLSPETIHDIENILFPNLKDSDTPLYVILKFITQRSINNEKALQTLEEFDTVIEELRNHEDTKNEVVEEYKKKLIKGLEESRESLHREEVQKAMGGEQKKREEEHEVDNFAEELQKREEEERENRRENQSFIPLKFSTMPFADQIRWVANNLYSFNLVNIDDIDSYDFINGIEKLKEEEIKDFEKLSSTANLYPSEEKRLEKLKAKLINVRLAEGVELDGMSLYEIIQMNKVLEEAKDKTKDQKPEMTEAEALEVVEKVGDEMSVSFNSDSVSLTFEGAYARGKKDSGTLHHVRLLNIFESALEKGYKVILQTDKVQLEITPENYDMHAKYYESAEKVVIMLKNAENVKEDEPITIENADMVFNRTSDGTLHFNGDALGLMDMQAVKVNGQSTGYFRLYSQKADGSYEPRQSDYVLGREDTELLMDVETLNEIAEGEEVTLYFDKEDSYNKTLDKKDLVNKGNVYIMKGSSLIGVLKASKDVKAETKPKKQKVDEDGNPIEPKVSKKQLLQDIRKIVVKSDTEVKIKVAENYVGMPNLKLDEKGNVMEMEIDDSAVKTYGYVDVNGELVTFNDNLPPSKINNTQYVDVYKTNGTKTPFVVFEFANRTYAFPMNVKGKYEDLVKAYDDLLNNPDMSIEDKNIARIELLANTNGFEGQDLQTHQQVRNFLNATTTKVDITSEQSLSKSKKTAFIDLNNPFAGSKLNLDLRSVKLPKNITIDEVMANVENELKEQHGVLEETLPTKASKKGVKPTTKKGVDNVKDNTCK